MSEKTPRQLGREAEVLRSYSYRPEMRLASYLEQREEELSEVTYNDKIASDDNTERDEGDKNSAEQARMLSQQSLKFIADKLQPPIDHFTSVSEARALEAKMHYEENAAGYHDLAVLEAAMDGVQINVQHSKNIDEHNQVNQK